MKSFEEAEPAQKIRVGLIGLGAIGGTFTAFAERAEPEQVEVVAALVRDLRRPRPVGVPQITELAELLALEPDVVAEAAGHDALRSYGPPCLEASIPLVILSVGALADARFEVELRHAALKGKASATIASGGVGALDMLASAAEGGLDFVRHIISKPAGALGVDVASRTELFRGSAREAAILYPQNANVAAAVALAGVGLDRSEVAVVADPYAAVNTQQIEAGGAFGSFTLSIQNRPSDQNPRTSAIVAMSLMHAVRKLHQPLVIG